MRSCDLNDNGKKDSQFYQEGTENKIYRKKKSRRRKRGYRGHRKLPFWLTAIILAFLLLMQNKQFSGWVHTVIGEITGTLHFGDGAAGNGDGATGYGDGGTGSGEGASGAGASGNGDEVSGNGVGTSGNDLSADTLEVHFLDVGHGDAALVICGEHAMMIDCGDAGQGTKLQNYLLKHGVERLDYLILTHPDKDHIGGAPVILTKFPIGQVFQSDFYKDNKTADHLRQTLKYKEINAVTPEVGSNYQLGGAYFTILAPNGTYEESNDSSIALMLHFGGNTFLFTGDAEKKAEEDMVDNSILPELSLKADVYQVGHHGSKSSSKKKFLKAVSPEFAVISCDYQGEDGHPHAEVLNRLREAGVKVFRTDEQGTIVAVSDGENITWNCAPSETWQAGEPTGSAESR